MILEWTYVHLSSDAILAEPMKLQEMRLVCDQPVVFEFERTQETVDSPGATFSIEWKEVEC